MLFGAGDGDIHQAALFFQLGVVDKRVGRREIAVERPEDKDRPPLQPFGGVDRGEYQLLPEMEKGQV